MKFTYKDKEIELKYSLRAMMMYENVTDGKEYPTTLTDMITLMYCIVVTSSKDYSITFDEWIEYLDEHMELLNEFTTWMGTIGQNQNKLKKD